MNIIQVGRPAVSRYHDHRRFYMTDEGVNYDVHDLPCGELDLTLGGFMALSGTENLGVCAEQEESDIADVDSDEEEEECNLVTFVDYTASSSSASASSST
jgi:hypothetical protein